MLMPLDNFRAMALQTGPLYFENGRLQTHFVGELEAEVSNRAIRICNEARNSLIASCTSRITRPTNQCSRPKLTAPFFTNGI